MNDVFFRKEKSGPFFLWGVRTHPSHPPWLRACYIPYLWLQPSFWWENNYPLRIWIQIKICFPYHIILKLNKEKKSCHQSGCLVLPVKAFQQCPAVFSSISFQTESIFPNVKVPRSNDFISRWMHNFTKEKKCVLIQNKCAWLAYGYAILSPLFMRRKMYYLNNATGPTAYIQRYQLSFCWENN